MDQIFLRGGAVDLDREREREVQPWKSFADNPIPSHSHSRCPGQSQRIIKLTDNSNTAKGFKSIWISITYEALLSSVAITSVLFILNFVYLPLFTRWSICTMREFHGCHAATYAAVPLCAFTLSFLVALLLSTLSSSNRLNEQLQEEFVQFSSNNYWTGRKPFPPGRNSTDDFANNNLKTGDGRDGDYDEGGISMRHGGGGRSLKWKGQGPDYDYDIDIENASSSLKHQNTIYPQVNASRDSIRVSKFLDGEENILLKNSDSNNNGTGFRFLDSTYAHFPTGAPPNSPKRKKNRKKEAELYRDRDHPQPVNNNNVNKVSDDEGGKKTQQCGSGNGLGPSFFHRNYIADGTNNKSRNQSESGIDCVEPPPHFYAEVDDGNQDDDILEDEKGISDEELDYLTLDELDMDDDILLSTEVKSHVGSQQNRNLGSSVPVPKHKRNSKVSFLDENDRYRAYLYGYEHDSDDDFSGVFPVAAMPTTSSPSHTQNKLQFQALSTGRASSSRTPSEEISKMENIGEIAIGMVGENPAQDTDKVRIRSQDRDPADRDLNRDRNRERTGGRRGSKVDTIAGAGTTSKTTLGMSSKMPCANINVINGSYNNNCNDKTDCVSGWPQNQLKNDDMKNILKQTINSPTRLVSLSGLSKIPRPKSSAQFSLPPEDD